MLERGNYVPWSSWFMSYIERKKNIRKFLKRSIEVGPNKFKKIPTTDTTTEMTESKDDLAGDDLKQYEADIDVMNLILLSIPNDIYNYVDEYENANAMWDRVKRLMQVIELIMQADRVDIQSKNVRNGGRYVRRNTDNQGDSTRNGNVEKEIGNRNGQRILSTTANLGNAFNVQYYNCNAKVQCSDRTPDTAYSPVEYDVSNVLYIHNILIFAVYTTYPVHPNNMALSGNSILHTDIQQIDTAYSNQFNTAYRSPDTISDEFLKILWGNSFNGTDGGDVIDHTAKVVEILEWIKIHNVDQNQLRLHVFPIWLSEDAKDWWNNEIEGTVTTWNELVYTTYPVHPNNMALSGNSILHTDIQQIDTAYSNQFNTAYRSPDTISDEFLKILWGNSFNGTDGGDVIDHTAKVVEILEWIKIHNVDQNQLRLHVFLISLSGDAKDWWDNEIDGIVTTWNELGEKFFLKYYPLSHTCNSKIPDDLDNETDYLEFLNWLGSKFKNYWKMDRNTKNGLCDASNPDELCRSKEFRVIRYSMRSDEEYITISPSKFDTWGKPMGPCHASTTTSSTKRIADGSLQYSVSLGLGYGVLDPCTDLAVKKLTN
ncbi:hypothetical protein Tco_1367802 [Tanacetum coccineum]